MPANFGVTSTFGLSASSGGVVEESSSEDEVEAKTIRDETGTTCRAIPSRMVKTTVSIKGRGRSDVSVAAGAVARQTLLGFGGTRCKIVGVVYECAW